MRHWNRKTRMLKPRSRRLNLECLEARLCLSTYTTVDLIPLAGHDSAKAFGLNDNGLAVGRSYLIGDSSQDAAVVWSIDPAGEALPFGLPGIDDARSLYGLEVNNQGMIAGESKTPDVDGGHAHAVLWTGQPGAYVAHDLGTLGETADGNFVFSGAKSVSEPDANGNIWVVGDSTTHYDSGPQIRRGVLWQIDSVGNVLSMTDLEPTSDNVDANDVRVIGGSVFVAGDFVVESPVVHACIWEADLSGSVVGRTDLGTAEFNAYQGSALNNDGDVAGTGYNSAHERHGFLYQNSAGSITDLGSLGNQGSYAWGINDSDVVVGTYYDVKPPGSSMMGDQYAFVWENGVMHPLLDQVSDRTFWLLFSANDVNEHGEIVGNGRAGKRNDSQEHGFLARPEDAPAQNPPVAVDDNYNVQPDTTLTVTAPGVLDNDTDADGDPMTAVLDAGPSSGTLDLSPDGSFTYTPNAGFTGTDSFTYVANDGTADSNVATVTIHVAVAGSETHSSTDTPLDIRDAHPKNNRARTTTFTLEIVNTAITSIDTLDVSISIDDGGTGFPDLSAELISPLGTSETIAAPLSSAVYSMSAFSSESLAGIWKLEITDSQNNSPHELTSWSLTATAQPAGASASEVAAAVDAALLRWSSEFWPLWY